MPVHIAGKLFTGLIVGAAVGATVALVLSSRAVAAPPRPDATPLAAGPTPFEPANALISRARALADELRLQVEQAIQEGKTTAAQTRQELTARFEAAKKGESGDLS